MKTAIWSLLVLAMGGVIGAIVTQAEFSGARESFDPHNGVGSPDRETGMTEVIDEAGRGLPPSVGAVLEVDGSEVHDFGYMENNSKGSHTFLLRNGGSTMLKLEKGGTSCQACTIAELERTEVKPGEGVRVTINWTVASPDLDYRKEAYILTNDPKRRTLILTVKGKVVKSVRVEDEEIRLGSVPATDGRTGQARIYCFRETPLEFSPGTFTNEDTKDKFTVELRPLTAEELSAKDGAVQGFLVTVSAQPGLPMGAILQTIRLESNWSDLRYVDIPIRGNVVSDVSIIAGKQFDPVSNVFRLDVVQRQEGRKVLAQIAVKGPERKDVRFTIGSVDPAESLRASIGEPKEVNGGAVVMFPLTIEVPVGATPISRLGGPNRDDYGRIRIKSTHSLTKEVQLLIRFAVE